EVRRLGMDRVVGLRPALSASIVGVLASPLGQGPLAAAVGLFPGRTPIDQVIYHPRLPQMAIVSDDLVLDLDLPSGVVRTRLKHPEDVRSATWDLSGQFLATACDDGRVRLWDVAAGKLARAPLEGFKYGGVTAWFQNGGRHLTTNGWSGLLHVWDPQSSRHLL